MKQYRLYFGILLAALVLTACSKDEEDPFVEDWKWLNEQAFNALANDPDLTELKSPGNNGSIYYRVIRQGEGKRLFYNSRAEVYYKGWFVADHPDTNNRNIKVGDVFDQRLFDDGVPFRLGISDEAIYYDSSTGVYVYSPVITGWTVALQNMVEGDVWEIYIPYRLGYDNPAQYGVLAYATLAFQIEVVKAIGRDEY